ncbi:MAG TPA: GNAT family N-acetyltransferase [Dongiaceae bacterium]|nr:GNAT family N-acetyltransferase [Dongiaceae bacterium]
MHIERIEGVRSFEAERERWERLERRDPHATVFTSWRWLRAYLPVARYRTFVLALREGDDAVAYLPLARGGSPLDRELYLAGNPTADYAGMIALPSRAEAAVGAFAGALIAEKWDAFNVCDVTDPRLETLVRRLVDRGMRLESSEEFTGRRCALPKTWDAYITERISAKTRVNTLRVERKLAEALPHFRVSEPTAADLPAHVEAMIAVNHARWGGNIEKARRRYGTLFRNAFEAGLLRMFVYWDGERPIAGATAFLDDLRSSFGLYMLGFDEAYDKLSPGKGIVGRAIRAAIESGYEHFDFLRGDEPFKARYAPDAHVTKNFRVTRPGLRSAAIAYARPKYLALKLQVANLVHGGGRSF